MAKGRPSKLGQIQTLAEAAEEMYRIGVLSPTAFAEVKERIFVLLSQPHSTGPAHEHATPQLAQRMRRAIETSKLSLNEIGRCSGLDTSQLSRFMQGKTELSLPASEKLCRFLHLGLASYKHADGKEKKK